MRREHDHGARRAESLNPPTCFRDGSTARPDARLVIDRPAAPDALARPRLRLEVREGFLDLDPRLRRESASLPPLSLGMWNTEGWFGAVLLGESSREEAARFLDRVTAYLEPIVNTRLPG